jgi:hypothetical protein
MLANGMERVSNCIGAALCDAYVKIKAPHRNAAKIQVRLHRNAARVHQNVAWIFMLREMLNKYRIRNVRGRTPL